jgi:hypothetical protein
MKRVLVYSYFCPDNPHRPGGVQQVVGSLISCLVKEFGWKALIAHPEPCHEKPFHCLLPDSVEREQSDSINPIRLAEAANQFRDLSRLVTTLF